LRHKSASHLSPACSEENREGGTGGRNAKARERDETKCINKSVVM